MRSLLRSARCVPVMLWLRPARWALTWLRQVSLRRNEWGSAPAYFAVIRAIVVSSMRLLKQKGIAFAIPFFAAVRRPTHCGYDPALRALTWLRQVSLRLNEWGSAPAYLAVINAIVVSSMRFEKPHSLSYQEETLTRRPETLVSVASKFDEAGLWL